VSTKQRWTVRVVMFHDDRLNPQIPGVWVEQLRHLGCLRILKEADDRTVLEFDYPGDPRGVDTKVWAEQEAERMASFELNAVAAPQWSSVLPTGA